MLTALLVLRSSSRPAGRSVIIAGEEPVGAEDVRYKLCTNFTLIIIQLFHVGVWTEMSFIVTELLHCLDSKDRKRMRVFKTWKTCQNKKRHLTFYPTAKRSVWLSGCLILVCQVRSHCDDNVSIFVQTYLLTDHYKETEEDANHLK